MKNTVLNVVTHCVHYTGFVGISLNIVWKEPKTNDPRDVEATERAMQFDLGWFANPIYGDGDYPEVMRKQIARKSMENGLMRSRLPEFTPAEIEMNRGNTERYEIQYSKTFALIMRVKTFTLIQNKTITWGPPYSI